MTSDTKSNEYRIESAELTEQSTLVVRGTVDESQMGPFVSGAFARVNEVAEGDGMHVSGPPFARLHPEADGTFEVEAGFPISGMLLGQGEVKAAHLPGGRALRTTHLGGYAQVWHAHEALRSFAVGHGLTPAGDAWEVYLDDPSVAVPRTLVVLPIRAADQPAAGHDS